jgi:hypothetical protein
MPITYQDIIVTRELGRGTVITTAPEHTKISVGLLVHPRVDIRQPTPGVLILAEQVAYEITGYDPDDQTLTLHLTHDWRPGQKDAPTDPGAEPTTDIGITPYLVVHRYRTDRGTWAWCVRCWGQDACDGYLALDLSDRAYAERKARQHLADAHPAPEGTRED